MAYTKLWHRIVTSSIWDEDDRTRIVWITMLAMANADGYVGSTLKSLAMLARVPVKACERALEILTAPDTESRTPDNDGRRIAKAEGGWLLLNYDKHRNAVSDDPAATKTRDRVRRYRALRNVTTRYAASASASPSSSESPGEGSGEGADGGGCLGRVPDIEDWHAEMDADGWSLEWVLDKAGHPTVAMSAEMAREYFDHRTGTHWVNANGRPVGRTVKDLMADMRTWKRNQGKKAAAGVVAVRGESPLALKERMAAASLEIEGLMSKDDEASRVRKAELRRRVAAWKRELAGG